MSTQTDNPWSSHSFTDSGYRRVGFWKRFTGEGAEAVGWKQSIVTLATYSWLNVLLIAVPAAWVIHFGYHLSHRATFAVSIIALLPLIKLLHFAGDQMALICGKISGDLVMITANNTVETIMSIILLFNCELRLLHYTITGFLLLRLLFVSGITFVTGGLRRKHQVLHAHQSQLNQPVLMAGALTLLLPTLFYHSVDHSPHIVSEDMHAPHATRVSLSLQLLVISRALSPLLLIVYACMCWYIHYPPGGEAVSSERDLEASTNPSDALEIEEQPKVNFWASFGTMVIVAVLMAVTAECLISSIQPMKTSVSEEWFGLVLMPFVAFAADGLLGFTYFICSRFYHWFGEPSRPAGSFAETRAIDLSIQFMLCWTPILVLMGWILNEPMSLLFGLFEVVLLISTCFLLNFVTLDSKTNWAGGVILITFYITVAITAWFHPGSNHKVDALTCRMPS